MAPMSDDLRDDGDAAPAAPAKEGGDAAAAVAPLPPDWEVGGWECPPFEEGFNSWPSSSSPRRAAPVVGPPRLHKSDDVDSDTDDGSLVENHLLEIGRQPEAAEAAAPAAAAPAAAGAGGPRRRGRRLQFYDSDTDDDSASADNCSSPPTTKYLGKAPRAAPAAAAAGAGGYGPSLRGPPTRAERLGLANASGGPRRRGPPTRAELFGLANASGGVDPVGSWRQLNPAPRKHPPTRAEALGLVNASGGIVSIGKYRGNPVLRKHPPTRAERQLNPTPRKRPRNNDDWGIFPVAKKRPPTREEEFERRRIDSAEEHPRVRVESWRRQNYSSSSSAPSSSPSSSSSSGSPDLAAAAATVPPRASAAAGALSKTAASRATPATWAAIAAKAAASTATFRATAAAGPKQAAVQAPSADFWVAKKDPTSLESILASTKRLFEQVDDKGTVTVKDIIKSLSLEYGCDKFEKSIKKAIKGRLTELVQEQRNAIGGSGSDLSSSDDDTARGTWHAAEKKPPSSSTEAATVKPPPSTTAKPLPLRPPSTTAKPPPQQQQQQEERAGATTAQNPPQPQQQPDLSSFCELFSCDICLELQVESTTLVPCGHSFCAACVLDECPSCRSAVRDAAPNRTLDQAIDNLTRAAPACFDAGDLEVYRKRMDDKKKRGDTKPAARVFAPRNAAAPAAAAPAAAARFVGFVEEMFGSIRSPPTSRIGAYARESSQRRQVSSRSRVPTLAHAPGGRSGIEAVEDGAPSSSTVDMPYVRRGVLPTRAFSVTLPPYGGTPCVARGGIAPVDSAGSQSAAAVPTAQGSGRRTSRRAAAVAARAATAAELAVEDAAASASAPGDAAARAASAPTSGSSAQDAIAID